MMICCYTELINDWNHEEREQKTASLPVALKKKILQKKQVKDIQLSVSGHLLLIHALKEFDLSLSLSNLEYDIYHRPFLKADIDFNIAHSGNVVICCATTNGKVGADIELVQPINFNDYTDYFTENEWQSILNSSDPLKMFFKFWTRKEAVLKAAGTGFFTPLFNIDIVNDSVHFNDDVYYLSVVKIKEGYECHIASTAKQPIRVIKSIL